MNDGASEVLEHFQAFRSRQEEALVSHLTAKGIREALLAGVEAEDTLPSLGKSLQAPQGSAWGGDADLRAELGLGSGTPLLP